MIRYILVVLSCLLGWSTIFAQSAPSEPSKYEVAAEFATRSRDSLSSSDTALGFGGRFTFNFNRHFALETAGYFFPKSCFDCVDNGREIQAFGGAKIGKRFKSWGAFAKARPGAVTFTRGQVDFEPSNVTGSFPFRVKLSPVTSFATDVGGVLEFYPSKRVVTRFDAGDTMIFFARRTFNTIQFDPNTGNSFLVPVPRPARTSHNFQFTASVGFRF